MLAKNYPNNALDSAALNLMASCTAKSKRDGGEKIPAGGWRYYFRTYSYTTKDGCGYFLFGLVRVGYIIEIDILQMPSYGWRDNSLHTTHRLNSDRGCYKICFGNPQVSNSIYSAEYWAKQWAKHTWNYILKGKQFPNS